jgi:hypothetical protein
MIGHIDILYSGQISGTTITGESISVSSVTVNNIISSGNTFSKFNLLSATTLSATTIQSAGLVGGGTQMVIANSDGVLSVQAIPVVGQSTVIRNGLNTYTAGTTADYSVNISALTINTLTASGNSVFTGTWKWATVNGKTSSDLLDVKYKEWEVVIKEVAPDDDSLGK